MACELGQYRDYGPADRAGAITAVAIMNEEMCRLAVPTAAFENLLCCPLAGWMRRHVNVENLPAGVTDHEEYVQRSKGYVWTQKKSHAQTADACCLRNDRQREEGPRRWVGCIYLAIVLAETLKPSLASSAWILRCPQSRFSMVMRRIRARNSGAIGRRPVFTVRRERRRQYAATPGGASAARYRVSQ